VCKNVQDFRDTVGNPYGGTVSYTYNADGTLASKTDANGNTETYTDDAYQRLAEILRCQQTFAYDTGPTGCVSAARKFCFKTSSMASPV
jgi:YD repeat-containing protein